MAVLPPDPVFCLKSDMGHVHSLCFDESDGDCTGLLYASTELGYVYLWDLNVRIAKRAFFPLTAQQFLDEPFEAQPKVGRIHPGRAHFTKPVAANPGEVWFLESVAAAQRR